MSTFNTKSRTNLSLATTNLFLPPLPTIPNHLFVDDIHKPTPNKSLTKKPVITPSTGTSRKLGSGGMGDVYLVERDEGPRALKTIDAARVGPNFRDYISAELLASIAPHKNIVTIYRAAYSPTGGIVEFEYLDGSDMFKIMQKGPISAEDASEMLIQISDALRKIHAFDIVHRDVKPENIFRICPHGETIYKLIDFGIATYITKELSNVQGIALGTPLYMSPEQARGIRTTASDIYSLGITAIELITCNAPFSGQEINRILQLKQSVPILDNALKDRWPKDPIAQKLLKIIEACVDIVPENRPTAQDLHQMLLFAISSSPSYFMSKAVQISSLV